MKKLLFSILATFLFVSSQSQNIDSLKNILQHAKEDTSKGLAIMSLVSGYMWSKPDSCLYYANVGLKLIENDDIRSEFKDSKNFLLSIFHIAMYANGAIGAALERNDSLAMKMAFKALALAKESKDKFNVPRVYGNMANVYSALDEQRMAIDYLKKATLLNTTLSEFERNRNIGAIGEYYFKLGEDDSAVFYLNKVYRFFQLPENNRWPIPDLYLAKMSDKKNDYNTALFHFRKAINISETQNIFKDLTDAYVGISGTFSKIGNWDSALFYASNSLRISNEFNIPNYSLEASSLLASIYESTHKLDSAFKYQKLVISIKDNLLNKERIKQIQNYTFNEQFRQLEIREQQKATRNRIKIYILLSVLTIVFVIGFLLWRNNQHKKKAYNLLKEQKLETDVQKEKVEKALEELKLTQSQLIQREKMASLGELTTGIAHEIQNPLNFVNNFSEVNKELLIEMKGEMDKGNIHEAKEIANDVIDNHDKINHHGKRADAIVKNMLQHSRTSSGRKELTDINALADEYLRLAFHGFRAKDKSFNAKTATHFDPSLKKINAVPQDIGRVILNLINNAFYSVNEKQKQNSNVYEPTVTVATQNFNDQIAIKVKDNGNGISQKILDKIFQPFFTTKPTGQGTGLGLSLSYDIVQAHGGKIRTVTKEGEGSEFIVELPVGYSY
jgi:two-component system NtrC family sensor kinase